MKRTIDQSHIHVQYDWTNCHSTETTSRYSRLDACRWECISSGSLDSISATEVQLVIVNAADCHTACLNFGGYECRVRHIWPQHTATSYTAAGQALQWNHSILTDSTQVALLAAILDHNVFYVCIMRHPTRMSSQPLLFTMYSFYSVISNAAQHGVHIHLYADDLLTYANQQSSLVSWYVCVSDINGCLLISWNWTMI